MKVPFSISKHTTDKVLAALIKEVSPAKVLKLEKYQAQSLTSYLNISVN